MDHTSPKLAGALLKHAVDKQEALEEMNTRLATLLAALTKLKESGRANLLLMSPERASYMRDVVLSLPDDTIGKQEALAALDAFLAPVQVRLTQDQIPPVETPVDPEAWGIKAARQTFAQANTPDEDVVGPMCDIGRTEVKGCFVDQAVTKNTPPEHIELAVKAYEEEWERLRTEELTKRASAAPTSL